VAQAFEARKQIVEDEHKEVVESAACTSRHGTSRVAPHRQSASRTRRPPGRSRIVAFFLSLEDDLMRIFAGDKVKALMQRLGMEKGVAIESKMVSKRIERRRSRSKVATSNRANTCSNTTTS
jgi:preprotein translocase subunit SecA